LPPLVGDLEALEACQGSISGGSPPAAQSASQGGLVYVLP
jgi:hypothetical protein